jgi:flagellar biosynthesis protein FliR
MDTGYNFSEIKDRSSDGDDEIIEAMVSMFSTELFFWSGVN